jgi:hypothetical protein
MSARSTLFSTFAAITLLGAAAGAQPAKPAADGTIAEARARFEEGLKLGEAGDHEAARLKFNQAWALIKTSSVLYNLARAEHSSNHPVESLDHFRAFSKLPDDGKITPTMRQRANEYIAELSKKVGQIEVEAPSGARITVDGRQVDMASGDPIAVMPGKHVVEATADGRVRSANVECTAGIIVKAKLVEETRAAPASAGGAAPALTPEKPVTDERSKDEASSGFWTAGRIVGTSIAALGVAGIGTGIGFHFAATSADDDIDRIKTELGPNSETACNGNATQFGTKCAELSAALDNRDTRETLRAAFLVGGGALLVGGLVVFLVSAPSASKHSQGTVIVPVLSAGQAGMSVMGRF